MAQEIKVFFDAETGELKAKLGGVQTEAKKAQTSMQKLGTTAQVALGNITAQAAVKAFQLLSGAIRQSFVDLKDFSRGIAEINSLLPGNVRLQKKTTDEFIRFSSTFGKDLNTQTKAFYDIISAGVKGTSEQLEFLEVSNQAAVAGLTQVSTAADILTTATNAYKSSNLTALEASDALFSAVVQGKTTFDELASTVGRVAPIAAQANLEFGELTGTLAFITKGGVQTDLAVTGLRNILTAIIKPTTEATAVAKGLGIQFDASALQTKKLIPFLEDLRNKTGGNIATLSKLFGNVRALGPALQILTGDFDDFKRVLNETTNATGATVKAGEKIKESLNFKVDVLAQSFKNLSLVLLENFGPALSEAADAFTKFTQGLSRFVAEHSATQAEKELNGLIGSLTELAQQKRMADAFDNTGVKIKFFAQQIDDTKFKVGELAAEFPELRKQAVAALLEFEKTGGVIASTTSEAVEAAIVKEEAITAEILAAKALRQELINEFDQEQTALAAEQTQLEKQILQQENDEKLASQKALLDNFSKQTKLANKKATLEKIKFDKGTFEQQNKNILDLQAFKAKELKIEKAGAAARGKINASLAGSLETASRGLNDALEADGKERSRTLFYIEKAAAIARILIATEVQAALAGAQTGIFGIPAQAAIRIQGAVSAALVLGTAIQGFAKGGEVTGGVPGRDSIPIMAQRGELISPRSSFDEVIGSVRASREAEKVQEQGGSTGGVSEIIIGMKDDFIEVVEQRIVERQSLGISILGAV